MRWIFQALARQFPNQSKEELMTIGFSEDYAESIIRERVR